MPNTNTSHAGRRVPGVPVALAAKPSEAGVSPWNVLAYEVALKGRGDVELTRADFDDCVANFRRFGKEIPVVLYHADTKPDAHPLAAAAHGWIAEMRVGSMARGGKTVATLEARFRWVNEATRAMVESGELAYGSVTLVQNGTDEESGEAIGSYLWSFSLTNNPALVDIPRIAAEAAPRTDTTVAPMGDDLKTSADVPPQNGGPRVATERSHMAQFMTLAARLGIAAASEEDAAARVAERAQETGDVRRSLNLSMDAPAGAVVAKLAELSAAAARVPGLVAEVEVAKAREGERTERELCAHIDAMIAAQPALKPVRSALEMAARADFAAFAAAHPLPKASASSLSQRVTGLGAEHTPANVFALPRRHNDAAGERAAQLMAADPKLTFEVALKTASREIKQGVR